MLLFVLLCNTYASNVVVRECFFFVFFLFFLSFSLFFFSPEMEASRIARLHFWKTHERYSGACSCYVDKENAHRVLHRIVRYVWLRSPHVHVLSRRSRTMQTKLLNGDC